MGRREEEIRMLSLQIGDVKRRVEVQKKKENTVPEVAELILRTSKELESEREMTEKLCGDLETPENLARWRPLQGEDPDMEQLMAKVQARAPPPLPSPITKLTSPPARRPFEFACILVTCRRSVAVAWLDASPTRALPACASCPLHSSPGPGGAA